jgi:hypothetical protein
MLRRRGSLPGRHSGACCPQKRASKASNGKEKLLILRSASFLPPPAHSASQSLRRGDPQPARGRSPRWETLGQSLEKAVLGDGVAHLCRLFKHLLPMGFPLTAHLRLRLAPDGASVHPPVSIGFWSRAQLVPFGFEPFRPVGCLEDFPMNAGWRGNDGGESGRVVRDWRPQKRAALSGI